MEVASMTSPLPTPPRTPYLLGAGCCRTWAFWRSRCPRSRSSCPPRNPPRPGAPPGTATGQPGPAPPSAADRACQQQRQALPRRQRPDPAVEGRRPRSRDGDLLRPAQFSGAPEPLVTYDLIGINSIDLCSLVRGSLEP